MGCFYLLVSYLLLNIMQNKELRVAVKPERIRLRRLLWPIVWQTLAAALIDEVATLVITHAFGVPAVLGVHGKPVQANEAGCKASDLASAECMICLSPATAESPLEAFCEHSGHLAHPSCMAKWYSAKGPQQTCPMCRQKLVITVWDSASVMRREGVLRGIAIVLQTSLRWEYAMYRFSLTALSVFSMLSILATRLSFARSLLRQISQESAGAAAAAIAASAVAPALSSDATPPSAAALGDLQSSVLDTVASLNANTDVIA
nr:hypothetical protein HK105_006350 [Polyrhizophydium stewartii]